VHFGCRIASLRACGAVRQLRPTLALDNKRFSSSSLASAPLLAVQHRHPHLHAAERLHRSVPRGLSSFSVLLAGSWLEPADYFTALPVERIGQWLPWHSPCASTLARWQHAGSRQRCPPAAGCLCPAAAACKAAAGSAGAAAQKALRLQPLYCIFRFLPPFPAAYLKPTSSLATVDTAVADPLPPGTFDPPALSDRKGPYLSFISFPVKALFI